MLQPNASSMLAQQPQDSFIKSCPTCTTVYDETKVQVIFDEPDAAMIHLTCEKCKQGVVALIGATQVGTGLVGLVTDMTCEDAVRFQNKGAITEDELLDGFEVLCKNQATFIEQCSVAHSWKNK